MPPTPAAEEDPFAEDKATPAPPEPDSAEPAAEAAGTHVAVVTATHRHVMETSHPRVGGYESLAALADPAGGIRIAVRAAEPLATGN